MERRRLMFMGLAGTLTATLGLAATAKAGILGDTAGLGRSPLPTSPDAESLEDVIQLALHHRGRGPRCWWENRTVRDRWGRPRTVRERVCR
jgi:hypothetical protein